MLRLMSNNQWLCDKNQPAWEEKGEDCSAEVREKGFARVYAETMPDVVGFQEVSGKMAAELMANLQALGLKYAFLWGKDTPIMYRPDKLELLDSDFALYPEEFPGHEGSFNNGKSKSWCLALFREKATGKKFIFVSTHLWWKSDNPASKSYQKDSGLARGYQMHLVIGKINEYQKKYPVPAVIVGDFNTTYHSEPVKQAFSEGFVHAHDVATGDVNNTKGHHGCGPAGYGTVETAGDYTSAIDHILLRDAPDGCVKNFRRFISDYYWALSDHFPVYIDVEF